MTWPRRGARAWVYGHRGVRDVAPENTMAAFELALQRGADGVEFDVQTSCDGKAIVFHDATLERMTHGRDCRTVSTLPAQELSSIRLDGGVAVPTLRDVFRWANGNGLYLNIELKCVGSDLATLVAAVEQDISSFASASLQQRIVVSSFSKDAIAFVNARGCPWPSARLLDRDELIDVLSATSIGTHPHFSSIRTPDDLNSIRESFVNVWTVNDEVTARRLNEWGVDGIITDELERVFEALNSQSH
jgi:glycerophosphoryl diester phosphodiesterase